jgi:hypothetical protein
MLIFALQLHLQHYNYLLLELHKLKKNLYD